MQFEVGECGGGHAGGDDDGDGDGGNSNISLVRLINLPPSSSSSTSNHLLPGPFVVMQGSPGDGMANTVDSMPSFIPSSSSPTTASISAVAGNNNNSAGSAIHRRRTSTMDRVLEELDSEIGEETDEPSYDDSKDRRGEVAGSPNDDDDDSSKPRSDSIISGRRQRRPRSDSDTEGGLHLPLGSSSPIMRNVALMGNNFMPDGRYGGPGSPPVRAGNIGRAGAWDELELAEGDTRMSRGMPLDDDGDGNESETGGSMGGGRSILKRRSDGQPEPSREGARTGAVSTERNADSDSGDGIRAEVGRLVQEMRLPKGADEMLRTFAGREDELLRNLRRMKARRDEEARSGVNSGDGSINRARAWDELELATAAARGVSLDADTCEGENGEGCGANSTGQCAKWRSDGQLRLNVAGNRSRNNSHPVSDRDIPANEDSNATGSDVPAESEGGEITSSKTLEELEAIRRWQNECERQELAHLDEANENVKLLIQRRKRSRERERLRLLSGDGRSPSPTATSASSGSSPSDSGSRVRLSSSDSGNRVRLSSSESVSSQPPPSSNSSDVNETRNQKEGEDPLKEILSNLELANSHRSWYQNDGRLVVLESLPRMSLRGEIVTHPIAAKSAFGSMCSEDLVTLAPGCTVMAEAVHVLDSRTLRRIHPCTSSKKLSPSSSKREPLDLHPQLAFLEITSPHEGYVLSSVHSYPLILPGLPTTYASTDRWLWRVTCRPDGAYVRHGLELDTEHLGTLPYGTVCAVTKKVVNGMGLNRLRVEAHIPRDENGGDGESANNDASFGTRECSGYISEFLNPLSGQRGNVVEPLSFPVPVLYRVVHARGCVVRSGVELSTAQIGFAPVGAVLSVVGRSFSDHPGHGCIERLRLAGGGGWISVALNKPPPENDTLASMVGVDGRFDPEDPAGFHFDSMRMVVEELRTNGGDNGGVADSGGRSSSFRRLSSCADLSEIGEDESDQQQPRQSSSSDPPVLHGAAPAVPILFRSGVVGGVGICRTSSSMPSSMNAMDAIRESSSDGNDNNHQRGSGSDHPNRCLICLSEERTATIVHGETGHIACCLTCARILKARGDNCPVCRLPIDLVIQQFWA